MSDGVHLPAEHDLAVELDPATATISDPGAFPDRWTSAFDERRISYAREKFLRIAPEQRYGRVLEVGAGGGSFIINLAQAGLIAEPFAIDIAPAMVEACLRNAAAVGVSNLKARAADAVSLPFDAATFDLVIGRAVLHHIEDVGAALSEAHRVLKPGGALVVVGEPTRLGAPVVRATRAATALAMRTLGAAVGFAREDGSAARHRASHAFEPRLLSGMLGETGFDPVEVRTEELVSGVFGWSMRTVETCAKPGAIDERIAWFAYRNYLRLAKLDDIVLRRIVPRPAFTSLMLSARKPQA